MNYIKMTDFRTKSPKVVETLESGESLTVVYRSKVIGELIPKTDEKNKVIKNEKDAKAFIKALNSLSFGSKKMTLKEARTAYRKAMEKKHGKGLS